MTHVTCRLTAGNWDQLRNPALGSRVWASFTFAYADVLNTWTAVLAASVAVGCVCVKYALLPISCGVISWYCPGEDAVRRVLLL